MRIVEMLAGIAGNRARHLSRISIWRSTEHNHRRGIEGGVARPGEYNVWYLQVGTCAGMHEAFDDEGHAYDLIGALIPCVVSIKCL